MKKIKLKKLKENFRKIKEDYEEKLEKMNEMIEEYKGNNNYLKKCNEQMDLELEKLKRAEINNHKIEKEMKDYKFEVEHKVY